MRNKYYYMAGSSLLILAQALSIWYASKMRVYSEKSRKKVETTKQVDETTGIFQRKPRALQKLDFRKATTEEFRMEKKTFEKKVVKKNGLKVLENPCKVPQYLYLVISTKAWLEGQKQPYLPRTVYVHFWKEEQLEFIGKDDSTFSEHAYVVLKVVTDKVEGKWIYKADKEGEEKYYQLYEGSIPRHAVVEAKTILKQLS